MMYDGRPALMLHYWNGPSTLPEACMDGGHQRRITARPVTMPPVCAACRNAMNGSRALARLYTGLYLNLVFLTIRNIYRFVE